MNGYESFTKINEVTNGNLFYKVMSSAQGKAICELFEVEAEYNHNVFELYGECVSLGEVFEAIAKDFDVNIIMVKYIFKMCTFYHNIDLIEKYFAKPYGNRYKDIQVIKGGFFDCLLHDLENNHSITEDKTVKRIYFYRDFDGKMRRL